MKDIYEEEYGPTIAISEEIHAMKYRGKGESFKEAMTRVAEALKDDEGHFNNFRTIFNNPFFLRPLLKKSMFNRNKLIYQSNI